MTYEVQLAQQTLPEDLPLKGSQARTPLPLYYSKAGQHAV